MHVRFFGRTCFQNNRTAARMHTHPGCFFAPLGVMLPRCFLNKVLKHLPLFLKPFSYILKIGG